MCVCVYKKSVKRSIREILKKELQQMNIRLLKNGEFIGILRYLLLNIDVGLFPDLGFIFHSVNTC